MKSLVAAFVFTITGCAPSTVYFTAPQKLTGEIMLVGSEPFTRIAVTTRRGRIYLISCDARLRKLLLSNQGRIAVLLYVALDRTRTGEQINVVDARIATR